MTTPFTKTSQWETLLHAASENELSKIKKAAVILQSNLVKVAQDPDARVGPNILLLRIYPKKMIKSAENGGRGGGIREGGFKQNMYACMEMSQKTIHLYN